MRYRTLYWLALVCSTMLAALSGCASRNTSVQTGSVYVIKEPPARRMEERPVRPVTTAVWIPGQWRWNGYRYVWLPGFWEANPRGVWRPGYWSRTDHGWVWVYGHWR